MIEEIPEEGIRLGDERTRKPEFDRAKMLVGPAAACLSDPDVWRNYEDDRLFEADSLFREWAEGMAEDRQWSAPNSRMRRYTFSKLFQLVTGERYEQSRHAKWIQPFTKVFRNYSTRIQKGGIIDGKPKAKTIYFIMANPLKRPPISIRLRIPWLVEHDRPITPASLKSQERKLLTPGHASNPRTEENMRRRSEQARRRYGERYRDRKH